MPPQRFALPAEVPGLAARRIAADILDGVLHKHRTLDEQLDGGAAHPGLKTLSDRDRALMRRLVATILRRLGTLGHVLSRLLDRGIPTDAPRAQRRNTALTSPAYFAARRSDCTSRTDRSTAA